MCSTSYQIPYEDLDVQDQIGGGGFSLVHRGFWKGTPVAIKKWFGAWGLRSLWLTQTAGSPPGPEVLTVSECAHQALLRPCGRRPQPLGADDPRVQVRMCQGAQLGGWEAFGPAVAVAGPRAAACPALAAATGRRS
jgi:hypothetical protein